MRGEPPSLFEAMQRREQGSGFDVERAARDLLDTTCDAQAVSRLEQERAQDQQVKRSLEQIGLWRVTTLLQTVCMRVARLPTECQ
jgi:hypothetical protein